MECAVTLTSDQVSISSVSVNGVLQHLFCLINESELII